MDQQALNIEDVIALKGATMLEFGAIECSYCQAAQSTINAALVNYPNVLHIKIEDGKGRRLGRLFHVKRWPTLVLLKDGIEVTRLVRETGDKELISALSLIG